MPIYEYVCEKCGETFEVFQKMSDPPPAKHSCGSKKLHRVMSQSSFVLKGTGWYITDYGRKNSDSTSANGKKEKKEKKEKPTESSAGEKKESSTPTPDKKPSASAA